MRISDWSSDVCSSDLSPISLLETGLHARGGKLILLCPEGFWRKGNVDITAERYGIEQVATMDELAAAVRRSEEHTSELQSLMRISYAVFCLKKKNITDHLHTQASYTTKS